MLYDCKRIPHRIDRRLTGPAEPDYDATIAFGLPFELEDSQYGKYRLNCNDILPRGMILPKPTTGGWRVEEECR